MNKQEFLDATKDYSIRGLVLAVDCENVKRMHGLIVQARELLDPPKPKIKLVCPHCGSDNIVRDGPLYWNVAKQEWVSNGSVYDDMICNDCDSPIDEADEREIKE